VNRFEWFVNLLAAQKIFLADYNRTDDRILRSVRRRLIITLLGSILSTPAAAQRPTADEQRRTIDKAREIAIHYTSMLPDFICTEQMQRTDRTSPTNKKADRLTIQLSYFGQKEKQKLVAMNGSPTERPLESLDGLITGGEFGSLLLGVFDPLSSADFQWKEASGSPASAGYHGEVALDNETSRVLRPHGRCRRHAERLRDPSIFHRSGL
jgi:hypothetical protein